jgi:hypothetical protein
MLIASSVALAPDSQLAEFLGKYYSDPLGFVLAAYPWGETGPLEKETGPDDNQREFLTALGEEVKKRRFEGTDPVAPIQMSESSGHGTGKSAQGAWITDWILSTRPYSLGTVTAGTAKQLETRTWAAIQAWTQLCITAHWFDIRAKGIFSKLHPKTWNVTPQTCKPENAQSFAGQHAKTSTSWYLFDEGSAVPDTIWKVALGGLTDGEPMFFGWGQCERNTGQFHEITHGRERDRWNHRTVDSRTSKFTNKELIAQWIRDYGEDSDWCRVRIFGLPPKASELQFIDRERVESAQVRVGCPLDDDPLVAGVDVSGGGAAWNVIRFRKGIDARSIPPIRMPGDHGREREALITKCAELLSDQSKDRRIQAMFLDSAFGAPIYERLRALGYQNVFEIAFGDPSADPRHQANMRAYMWDRMKDWLPTGMIDKSDERLAIDLCSPGYRLNRSSQLVIEPKEEIVKRIGHSPDDGDALALTFARKVAPLPKPTSDRSLRNLRGGWMS